MLFNHQFYEILKASVFIEVKIYSWPTRKYLNQMWLNPVTGKNIYEFVGMLLTTGNWKPDLIWHM